MRSLGNGIHVFDRSFRLYGLEIGTRMTIVELDEGLWVHSPVQVDEAVVAEVAKLGEIAHLVAPSAVHHLFVGDWKKRHPSARMYGPAGLAKKRPDLSFDELLSNEAPAAWSGAIDQRFLEGAPYLEEFAFFHRRSRTLILTDHILHFGEKWPLGTRLAMRVVGAYQKATSPRDFGLMIKDRRALNASMASLLSWDFDRIVISHGDLVEHDGKRALRAAFRIENV